MVQCHFRFFMTPHNLIAFNNSDKGSRAQGLRNAQVVRFSYQCKAFEAKLQRFSSDSCVLTTYVHDSDLFKLVKSCFRRYEKIKTICTSRTNVQTSASNTWFEQFFRIFHLIHMISDLGNYKLTVRNNDS